MIIKAEISLRTPETNLEDLTTSIVRSLSLTSTIEAVDDVRLTITEPLICCECHREIGNDESMVRNNGQFSHLEPCPSQYPG